MDNASTATVGVIIATCNDVQYIQECIDSIINQSYPVSQIVICDDFSEDGNRTIIQANEEKYHGLIERVFHNVRVGIPRNFNSGLRKIKTDYWSIVAGDDYWHRDKIRMEIELLMHTKAARWAYSGAMIVDEKGKELGRFSRKYEGCQGDILYPMLLHEMCLRNLLVEKSLSDEVGVFDESFEIFEDWDYKIRLAEKAEIVFVPHYHTYYRQHGNGASGSTSDVYYRNLIKAYRKHHDLIEKQPATKKERILFNKELDLAKFSS